MVGLNVFIHESSIVDSDSVGVGTRIWEFSHILAGAVIGKSCNICAHCFIENNVIIGDRVTIKNGVSIWDGIRIDNDVFIGPNATFTNDLFPRSEFKKEPGKLLSTELKEGCTIGANATVLGGISLGRYCFVAAAAVVTKDVPDYGLVVGNPGKVIGFVCKCAKRIKEDKTCECGRSYKLSDGILVQVVE